MFYGLIVLGVILLRFKYDLKTDEWFLFVMASLFTLIVVGVFTWMVYDQCGTLWACQ